MTPSTDEGTLGSSQPARRQDTTGEGSLASSEHEQPSTHTPAGNISSTSQLPLTSRTYSEQLARQKTDGSSSSFAKIAPYSPSTDEATGQRSALRYAGEYPGNRRVHSSKIFKRYRVLPNGERIELPLDTQESSAIVSSEEKPTQERLSETYQSSKPMSFQRAPPSETKRGYHPANEKRTTPLPFTQEVTSAARQSLSRDLHSPDEKVELSERGQLLRPREVMYRLAPRERVERSYPTRTSTAEDTVRTASGISATSAATTATSTLPSGYTDSHLEEAELLREEQIADKRHREGKQIRAYERQQEGQKRRDPTLSENESIEEAPIPGLNITEKVVLESSSAQFVRTEYPFHSEFIEPADFPIITPSHPKPLMLTFQGDTRILPSVRDAIKNHPHIQNKGWAFQIASTFPLSHMTTFVHRTLKQFKFLRNELCARFPGALVPPVPSEKASSWKSASGKLGLNNPVDVSSSEIMAIRIQMQLFLDHVAQNSELSNAEEFLRFLSYPYAKYDDYRKRHPFKLQKVKRSNMQLQYLEKDFAHMDRIRITLEQMREAFSDLVKYNRDSSYSLVRVHESANAMNRFEDARSGINPLLQGIRAATMSSSEATSALVHNLGQQREVLSFYARWSEWNMHTIYRFDQLQVRRDAVERQHQEALSAAQYFFIRRKKHADRFSNAEKEEKNLAFEVDAFNVAIEKGKHMYSNDLTHFHVSRRSDVQELLNNFIIAQYENSSAIHDVWKSVYDNSADNEENDMVINVHGHRLVEERIGHSIREPRSGTDDSTSKRAAQRLRAREVRMNAREGRVGGHSG